MDIIPISEMRKLRPDMLSDLPKAIYGEKLAVLGFKPGLSDSKLVLFFFKKPS